MLSWVLFRLEIAIETKHKSTKLKPNANNQGMWRQRKLYDNLLLQTTHQVTGNGASNCVFFGKRDKDPKHVQRPLKAVVFDLDGTLTVPVLDFARMRRETGILHGDILVELEKMDTENRKRCEAIIERIEGWKSLLCLCACCFVGMYIKKKIQSIAYL